MTEGSPWRWQSNQRRVDIRWSRSLISLGCDVCSLVLCWMVDVDDFMISVIILLICNCGNPVNCDRGLNMNSSHRLKKHRRRFDGSRWLDHENTIIWTGMEKAWTLRQPHNNHLRCAKTLGRVCEVNVHLCTDPQTKNRFLPDQILMNHSAAPDWTKMSPWGLNVG